jgi:hypothetical protein
MPTFCKGCNAGRVAAVGTFIPSPASRKGWRGTPGSAANGYFACQKEQRLQAPNALDAVVSATFRFLIQSVIVQ